MCLLSCGDKPADTSVVKQEMAARELKRVSNADLLTGAKTLSAFIYVQDTLVKQNVLDSLSIASKYLTPDLLDEDLLEVLEAYDYQLDQGEQLEDYIQLRDTVVEVFHPLVVSDSIVIWRMSIPIPVIVRRL